jgi:hypothetical protein
MVTPSQSQPNKTLIITGRHRSGTTFTARWLQSCGLFIGKELLYSKYEHANPNGAHYEDLDFLHLHRRILRANGLSGDGSITDEAVSISSAFRQEAEQLVMARRNEQNWGWKEPRTCLFLDFWRALLPDAYHLVVYRHYERVADSLLRRKVNHPLWTRRVFYRLRYRNIDSYIAHHIRVWTRYNHEILNALQHQPDRMLVLRIGDVVPHSQAIINLMNTQWGFQLTANDAATIYDDDRMQKQASFVRRDAAPVQRVTPQAEAVFQALEEWRSKSLTLLSRDVASGE